MPTERLTYTVAEAGRLLGVSRGSAYQAARAGQIPTLRIGRRLLVSRHALEQLLGAIDPPASNGSEGGGHIEEANGPGATASASDGATDARRSKPSETSAAGG